MSKQRSSKNENTYNQEKLISAIEELLNNNLEHDSQFEDKFQTHEQKERDEKITELLDLYVSAYDNKTKVQQSYRKVLFWGGSGFIGIFAIVIAIISIIAVTNANEIGINGLVSIISALATLLTSVIGLIHIITKFCFPVNDEQYITQIVESIQKNDLENKKENMQLLAKINSGKPVNSVDDLIALAVDRDEE